MSSNNIYQKEFRPTFLYIKRHRITGKLYLGITAGDLEYLLKYKGSGRYWNRHITIHGRDCVDTVWYCRYYDREELTKFAVMCSEQWNIVYAKDDDGNKIWANEKIEDGLTGGKMSAESLAKAMSHPHPSKIKITCPHCNRTVGKPNYSKSHGDKCRLNPDSTYTPPDTSGSKNHHYDHTLYDFYNMVSGEHVTSTMFDLRTKYSVPKTLIRDLVTGKIKYLNNWQMSPVKFYKFENAGLNLITVTTQRDFSDTYNLRHSIVGEVIAGKNKRKSINGWTVTAAE